MQGDPRTIGERLDLIERMLFAIGTTMVADGVPRYFIVKPGKKPLPECKEVVKAGLGYLTGMLDELRPYVGDEDEVPPPTGPRPPGKRPRPPRRPSYRGPRGVQ